MIHEDFVIHESSKVGGENSTKYQKFEAKIHYRRSLEPSSVLRRVVLQLLLFPMWPNSRTELPRGTRDGSRAETCHGRRVFRLIMQSCCRAELLLVANKLSLLWFHFISRLDIERKDWYNQPEFWGQLRSHKRMCCKTLKRNERAHIWTNRWKDGRTGGHKDGRTEEKTEERTKRCWTKFVFWLLEYNIMEWKS